MPQSGESDSNRVTSGRSWRTADRADQQVEASWP